MAKTLLICGGAGFIGSNFIRWLLANSDVSVVNYDALTYAGNLENLSDLESDPRYTFVHGDIRDAAALSKTVGDHNFDGIINFAAETHVDRSISGPAIFVDTNVSGTLALLECARSNGIRRFLQISTDEVYGTLGRDGTFAESSPLQPNSPYAASKTSADLMVRAYHHTYGMDTVITRCSNNYGPRQFPEKLIPLMILNALDDEPLPVYGDGLNVRDWIHVDDHCSAVWAVYCNANAGEVYNIGADGEQANIDVVRAILQILGKSERLIRFVADRPGHDFRYSVDASALRSKLGWQPRHTFEEGLRSTIDWYRANADWCAHVRSGAYREYYRQHYKL